MLKPNKEALQVVNAAATCRGGERCGRRELFVSLWPINGADQARQREKKIMRVEEVEQVMIKQLPWQSPGPQGEWDLLIRCLGDRASSARVLKHCDRDQTLS